MADTVFGIKVGMPASYCVAFTVRLPYLTCVTLSWYRGVSYASVVMLTTPLPSAAERRSRRRCRRRPVHTIVGLCWAKLASSTNPQKPPATYTRSMILDHLRTRFLWGNSYARATYTRVYTVSESWHICRWRTCWSSLPDGKAHRHASMAKKVVHLAP